MFTTPETALNLAVRQVLLNFHSKQQWNNSDH